MAASRAATTRWSRRSIRPIRRTPPCAVATRTGCPGPASSVDATSSTTILSTASRLPRDDRPGRPGQRPAARPAPLDGDVSPSPPLNSAPGSASRGFRCAIGAHVVLMCAGRPAGASTVRTGRERRTSGAPRAWRYRQCARIAGSRTVQPGFRWHCPSDRHRAALHAPLTRPIRARSGRGRTNAGHVKPSGQGWNGPRLYSPRGARPPPSLAASFCGRRGHSTTQPLSAAGTDVRNRAA